MGFLQRLRSFFGSSTPQSSSSEFGGAVREDEIVARFIFQRSYIRKTESLAKPDAFLPNGTPLQTSVFRTDRLTDEETWSIGAVVASVSGRSLKARADFVARAISGTPLRFDPDNHPERHANIVGWPEEKSDRLMLASIIAAEATLFVVKPS